uniref:Uncharacterized protein n=1 Tax=Anguilla anguilla TaxID=7936 RepID=A0A0E9W162_ANGAN
MCSIAGRSPNAQVFTAVMRPIVWNLKHTRVKNGRFSHWVMCDWS